MALLAILVFPVMLGCSQRGSGPSDSTDSSLVSVETGESASTSNEVPTEPEQRAGQAQDDILQTSSGESMESIGADLADSIRQSLNLSEDYRSSFVHGDKPAECQKYIILHDSEGESDAANVIEYWDGSGAGVASHFVVNKDGSIVQCVPLDKIAHHAGFGDAGHNELFGVEDESRDDKVGTVPIGSEYPDYGMNSWSIGIEMVHVGDGEDYPEAQLEALDNLIAYIDAYYGFQSSIIDHKAWRTTNSDTSVEFATYLHSYQTTRTHTQ